MAARVASPGAPRRCQFRCIVADNPHTSWPNMADASLITDFAIVLGVAALTGTLARRLGQPAILGYLAAGLIVGPYIPIPLFADVERVHRISELGVVLVMFAVGLEFSLQKAVKVLPVSGLAAAVQIAGMFWAGSAVGALLGFASAGQVVLGAAIAVSSTMVVTKVFDLHPPPDDVRGAVLGVLVLQDVVAIVLITIVTAVSRGAEADADAIASVVGRLGLVILAVVLVGLVIVPRAARAIARLDSPEVDVLFAVGVCFAFAAMLEHLDYSPALGAFLAGMLVADSGLSERFEHVVAPLRDTFAAIFFVSIGMTVDPRVAFPHLGEAALLTLVVILLQFGLILVAGLVTGLGFRRAGHAGLALGQIGEFAFIIVGIGAASGVVPDHLLTVLVMVAVATAFTTSTALARASWLLSRLEALLPERAHSYLRSYGAWLDRLRRRRAESTEARSLRRAALLMALDAAVIAAVLIGAALARPWLVDETTTRLAVSPAVPSLALLVLAGLLSFPSAWSLWRLAGNTGQRLAAAAFPEASADRPDLNAAPRGSVALVIRLGALFGAGLLVVGLTAPFLPQPAGLLLLSVALAPSAVAAWRSTSSTSDHLQSATLALYELLRSGRPQEGVRSVQIDALLGSLGDVVLVEIGPGDASTGQTLSELDVRERTGATVLAIAQDGDCHGAPTGQEMLRKGDVLALVGPSDAVERARELLIQPHRSEGPPPEDRQTRSTQSVEVADS